MGFCVGILYSHPFPGSSFWTKLSTKKGWFSKGELSWKYLPFVHGITDFACRVITSLTVNNPNNAFRKVKLVQYLLAFQKWLFFKDYFQRFILKSNRKLLLSRCIKLMPITVPKTNSDAYTRHADFYTGVVLYLFICFCVKFFAFFSPLLLIQKVFYVKGHAISPCTHNPPIRGLDLWLDNFPFSAMCRYFSTYICSV